MINAFCTEWYQKTGHGVLIVFAAVGGAEIQKFLPVSDPLHLDGPSGAYVYEYLAAAVSGAREKAATEDILIAGSYFVSFQGEANTPNSNYAAEYERVVSYLEGMGLLQGALIEPSVAIGEANDDDSVRQIHEQEEEIIAEDPTVCLGSFLDYDHYLSDKTAYEGADSYWRDRWGGLSYDEAYRIASLLTDTEDFNRIHLNSTALFMIGRQTADHLADETGAVPNDSNLFN